MSPRFATATVTELSRVGLFQELAGEVLTKLAQNMEREEIGAGSPIMFEGERGDRFYVVLRGLLAVNSDDLGARRMLRPGDYFGEVALAMGMPRTASVRAVTTAVVASCDRETFDELLRPIFADV